MQYVAVVVGCELAVEDGSFVRLLKVAHMLVPGFELRG